MIIRLSLRNWLKQWAQYPIKTRILMVSICPKPQNLISLIATEAPFMVPTSLWTYPPATAMLRLPASPKRSLQLQLRRRGPGHNPRRVSRIVSVTVIGSSIVRGVAPLVHGDTSDATGHVCPGQTASQINARIRHIPSSDVTVLATGTYNIEHQTLDQCKNELA